MYVTYVISFIISSSIVLYTLHYYRLVVKLLGETVRIELSFCYFTELKYISVSSS